MKKGAERGEREGEKKRDKRELRRQFEEEEEEHHHLPLLVVQLPQGTAVFLRRHEFPTRLCKSAAEGGSGSGKMANLVKGSSMRQKLQNSKGYAESPEFLSALGLSLLLQLQVN